MLHWNNACAATAVGTITVWQISAGVVGLALVIDTSNKVFLMDGMESILEDIDIIDNILICNICNFCFMDHIDHGKLYLELRVL